MNQRAGTKRLRPWLRFLAWCGFCILSLATLLVVTRWLVINHGHQETLRITRSQGKKQPALRQAEPQIATAGQETPQGMSLSAVPHFGRALTGDEQAWKEFLHDLGVDQFLSSGNNRNNPIYVNGVVSFRAMLQNMGGEVPETMTEAEAAAEFLKRADRFSGLLARWSEAVAKGPMAREHDYWPNPGLWRFNMLAVDLSELLKLTSAARLRTGNSDAAWADWQLMKNSNDREGELFPVENNRDHSMSRRMYYVAQLGIWTGTWSEAQLAELSEVAAQENFIAGARKDFDREKKEEIEYYENFRKNEEFRKDFLKTPSPFNQLVNRVKLQLITDQQIKDNQALSLHRLDQGLSRFDPETGYYRQPTEAEKQAAKEKSEPGMFGSYYFMIADMHVGNDDYRAKRVILQQAGHDQLRLSAALETYQRRTGNYPENLEEVGSQFPGGAPRDIATGQPYFYQKEADGGYKLWSTGIDGKSDGGDDKNDITWKQPGRGN
jgi:hypothetical protein